MQGVRRAQQGAQPLEQIRLVREARRGRAQERRLGRLQVVVLAVELRDGMQLRRREHRRPVLLAIVRDEGELEAAALLARPVLVGLALRILLDAFLFIGTSALLLALGLRAFERLALAQLTQHRLDRAQHALGAQLVLLLGALQRRPVCVLGQLAHPLGKQA